MKKSKRHASRYTAKKRRMKYLEATVEELTDRLRAATKPKRQEEGVTTIKVGPAPWPQFGHGRLFAINLVIDVDQFFRIAMSTNRGGVWDISRVVDRHCQEVAHKLRAALLEHAEKGLDL